jgi:hypothetical protein
VDSEAPQICAAINDTVTQEQVWCDGDSATIDCGSQSIEIVCAFYGIDQTVMTPCGLQYLPYHPKCYFSSSFDLVKSQCNNQNSCSFYSFSSTFDVPCSKLTNALYIQWRCI